MQLPLELKSSYLLLLAPLLHMTCESSAVDDKELTDSSDEGNAWLMGEQCWTLNYLPMLKKELKRRSSATLFKPYLFSSLHTYKHTDLQVIDIHQWPPTETFLEIFTARGANRHHFLVPTSHFCGLHDICCCNWLSHFMGIIISSFDWIPSIRNSFGIFVKGKTFTSVVFLKRLKKA